MKKILLGVLGILILAGGINLQDGIAQSITQNYPGAALPKMALVLNKPTPTYYIGEDIWMTLTVQNQSGEIITTQGFMKKDFTLGLRFTDPNGNLITVSLPTGAVLPTPPPPPVIVVPGAEPITGDYIEVVPLGWVWSNTFNALDSYTLTKAGNYSVKAKFSMSDYPVKFETAPGSGVFYSPLESGISGDVESNVLSFTLLSTYSFTGFFSPINNLPVFNRVKAGAAVPVKFSLNGNQGLNIFASGYPSSGTIACSPDGQVDVVEETVTAGSSSLSYDPALNQYTYVWKTNKAWSNTCRQLVIKFQDGSYQQANFQFTR